MANGKAGGATTYDAREANLVRVSPAPGTVFIRLRRRFPDQPEAIMFTELTVGEAVAVLRDLKQAIEVAICGEINRGPAGR